MVPRICRLAQALFVALLAATMFVAPAGAEGDVGARAVTIDFSTHGSGKAFDPLYYRTAGITLPALRCGTTGCVSWFVGYVQGDDALIGGQPFGAIRATFTRPVADLALRVAPAFQGTGVYTLTAYDDDGAIIATRSLTVTQDTGNPATGPFGYFSIDLPLLARPAKSFTLDGWMERSTFPQNLNLEFGVSSISYTHWEAGP